MPLRILHYADVERAPDDPELLARLVGLVRERRDEETLVFGAGDNLGPGVLSLVTDCRHALDFFEAVRPDGDTFGNHDFDHGPEATRAVVADSPMPWLCANVFDAGEPFAADEGAVPWAVLEAGEHRVGVTGVASPETPDINPSAEGLSFGDPVAAADDAVAALRERDVDHVVVLSHCGDDTALAEQLDVDVVLGGHAHEEFIDRVAGTLLVRAGSNASGLSEVVFNDRPTAYRLPTGDAPVAEDLLEALEARRREAGLTDTIATLDEPVTVTRADTKQGESRVGNLVTDAYRWVSSADIAVHSSGGLRTTEPLVGDVTAADIIGLCPFENELVSVRITGEQVRRTVHDAALAQYGDEVPTHWFGHLSGLSVVWDDEFDEAREVRVRGEPLEHDATYTLATSGYYVESSHLFDAFGPTDVVATHGQQYEAIVEYAREHGVDPSIEGRIERPTLDAVSGAPADDD
ncbi:bifunctional metallophosphatase/5'-nucleotidase [Haloarchaeobius iranensis]|uniref:2',3'-cyclic-nucleotide 2'-phosphodiesterase/5'-or 3'-nucleotidase, 5'-nucleotidase family n=1 Tax=Haloarchaeobius iranensis TaxID=996166 RepID=A0A1G9VWS7_9EURY|nr:bifunctional UDP-sugar hydrolase/5'-nucleotidase [Haloarchaeobius iranensis]SDM76729.1 2',3'-cyclic-nucleotide 2'-phosphodiesterase/5'-or 3'-nucleotidase, 5'-nucleotidase family [Haloarchaeobius iranensis]